MRFARSHRGLKSAEKEANKMLFSEKLANKFISAYKKEKNESHQLLKIFGKKSENFYQYENKEVSVSESSFLLINIVAKGAGGGEETAGSGFAEFYASKIQKNREADSADAEEKAEMQVRKRQEQTRHKRNQTQASFQIYRGNHVRPSSLKLKLEVLVKSLKNKKLICKGCLLGFPDAIDKDIIRDMKPSRI